jgi:hypothetical protein
MMFKQCTNVVHNGAVQHGTILAWLITTMAVWDCTNMGRGVAVQHSSMRVRGFRGGGKANINYCIKPHTR